MGSRVAYWLGRLVLGARWLTLKRTRGGAAGYGVVARPSVPLARGSIARQSQGMQTAMGAMSRQSSGEAVGKFGIESVV